MQPDPNPVELSLPWGKDLELTPDGDLFFVSGVEKVRQRIIRRFFTCSERTLADGDYVGPDYLFDKDYGIGATRLVGEPISAALAQALEARIKDAVLVDESVNSNQDPEVKLYAAPNGQVWVSVKVVLTDGTTDYLNFPVKK